MIYTFHLIFLSEKPIIPIMKGGLELSIPFVHKCFASKYDLKPWFEDKSWFGNELESIFFFNSDSIANYDE